MKLRCVLSESVLDRQSRRLDMRSHIKNEAFS